MHGHYAAGGTARKANSSGCSRTKKTVICPAGVQAGMNLRIKTFPVIVPTEVLPGQEFPWPLANGTSVSLTCPPNVLPGQFVLFGLPIADS